MTLIQPAIVLITGIMASGKSTVAQKLAEKLDHSVHLRGDTFRKMIVHGRASMDNPLTAEAMGQLIMRYRISAGVAHHYCEAGFTVIYQDVILGAVLNNVVALYRDCPLFVIVLCPSPEVVLHRDAIRHKQTYGSWTPHDLDIVLREETPKLGLWIDTSQLRSDETVSLILERIDEARVSH